MYDTPLIERVHIYECTQKVFGAIVMYVLKLGGALRGSLKPLHKRLGLMTFILGMITIVVGLQEYSFKVSIESYLCAVQ